MTFVLFGKPTETKELQVVFYQLLAMILGGALGNRSQIEHQWDDDLHMLCWLLNLQFFFGVSISYVTVSSRMFANAEAMSDSFAYLQTIKTFWPAGT